MAYIARRKNADGEVTSFQVKWRLGGARTAPQQTERFDDEDSAEVFKKAVNDNGQQWPPGWVKGLGFIDESAGDEAQYVFRAFATESVEQRTGIEERYRADCMRELETYIFPTFANCDVRSTEHFSSRTVRAWVNLMTQTRIWRGSHHKEMSPKTLKNLHGLLSSILQEAVKAEPPLRARNPCELTRLPRTDDDGAEDDESEDMEFLTPEEVEGIVSCLKRPEDKLLVRTAYGTGFRWGEITALARRHAIDTEPGKPKLRVARAWKWSKEESYYLGKPKSRRSRRTIRVTDGMWQELAAGGALDLSSNKLIFHNGQGERLPYSTFYDRWMVAVVKAKELGLLSDFKNPTFHDLRHSHVAALISAGRSLTYVQRRVGHESIKTTSDKYGHLLPEADDDAMETIAASLGHGPGGGPVPDTLTVPAPAGADESLYVAHLGLERQGFWKRSHAEETAAVWAQETGGSVRVETWSAAWWARTIGNGIRGVRSEVPDRVWLWELGPAVYAADGTECVTPGGVHEVRGRWAWEWEQAYTGEPAQARAEWRPGPGAETEAAAWGLDQAAVRAAYAQARTDALRVCGLHPALRVSDGEEAVT